VTGFRGPVRSARLHAAPCLRRAAQESALSDRSFLIFALCILAAGVADAALNGGAVLFFLLLKLADLVEWLAFWR